jgi:DNA-binding response OmpR family regulator
MSQQKVRPTALVVETNFLIASVIEAPLAAAGYRVLVAVEAAEALEILGAEQVQVALIDFRLQHIEPEGLVHALGGHNVPFIFCTAASVEEVNEHFPEARVVTKPFSDDQLVAAVAALHTPPAPAVRLDFEAEGP